MNSGLRMVGEPNCSICGHRVKVKVESMYGVSLRYFSTCVDVIGEDLDVYVNG
jgi:hypothetical protein